MYSQYMGRILKVLLQVSKSWQRLCYDGQLWATFDATDFYKDIPVEKLALILLRAGPFVRHLNLR